MQYMQYAIEICNSVYENIFNLINLPFLCAEKHKHVYFVSALNSPLTSAWTGSGVSDPFLANMDSMY